MKRTTIKISEDLDARMRHEASRRGSTISEITREALEAYLLEDSKSGRRKLSFAKAGRSGHRDVSARIEELLEAEIPRG